MITSMIWHSAAQVEEKSAEVIEICDVHCAKLFSVFVSHNTFEALKTQVYDCFYPLK